MNAIDYTTLTRKELRSHAKAQGIKYGKLSQLQIREALAGIDTSLLTTERKTMKHAKSKSNGKTVKTVERKQRTGTKMEKALAIVRDNPKADRQEVLALFMSKAKLTKAGAATYYSMVMKRK